MTPELTIGISTRNRPQSLCACIESLSLVAHLGPEIIVFDDGSDVPAAVQLSGVTALPSLRVIRDEAAPGTCTGRNRIVREANAPFVLLLDDDTRLSVAEAVTDAMALLRCDAHVGAIAFAQGEPDGSPWPAAMQPSAATVPVLVPSYIGFAHMVRRDVFLALGGYRETFQFQGEEKELGLRLLDAGYRIVYLPDAIVMHLPDPSGRDPVRYLRLVARNDCLASLYNDPFSRLAWMLPVRYALYFRMRRNWKIPDPWGWAWLAREIVRTLPDVRRGRRPVSRAALREWAAMRRQPIPYHSLAQTR